MNPQEQQGGVTTVQDIPKTLLDQIVAEAVERNEAQQRPFGSADEYTEADVAALGLPGPGALNFLNRFIKRVIGTPWVPRWMYDAAKDARNEEERIRIISGCMLAVVVRGREMKFDTMESVEVFYKAPDGRLGMYAKPMTALMLKAGAVLKHTIDEDDVHELYGKRQDGNDYTSRFTQEDAQRAGLTQKDYSNHKKYPRRMLKWRCLSDMFNTLFADLTGTSAPIYTAEELIHEAAEEINDQRSTGSKSKNVYMAGMEDIPTQDDHAAKATVDKEEGHKEAPAQPAAASGVDSTAASSAAPSSPVQAEESKAGPRVDPQPEPPKEEPKESKKKQTDFGKMVESFQDQKERLGEKIYRQILGNFGVESPNQFKTLEDGRKCYRAMDALTLADIAAFEERLKPETPKEPEPAPATEKPGPTLANKYVEEVRSTVDELCGLYTKKSPDAVKKLLDAFLKGFYGDAKPKPDANNIEGLRKTLRLLRVFLTYKADMIVENAAKAQATGNAVSLGYREALKFLADYGPLTKEAYFECIEKLWWEDGGACGSEYVKDVLGATPQWADEDLAILLRLTARRPSPNAKSLLNQVRITGVSASKIVAGWAIDINTAPIQGINAFLKAAAEMVPEPKTAPNEAELPAVQQEIPVEDEGDDWLLSDKD